MARNFEPWDRETIARIVESSFRDYPHALIGSMFCQVYDELLAAESLVAELQSKLALVDKQSTVEQLDEHISWLQERVDGLEADLSIMCRHAEALEIAAGVHGGYAELTIDGKTGKGNFVLNGSGTAREGNVAFHAYAETVDDGYDVAPNGDRCKRIKPGAVTYWVTQNDSVWFVTTRKPERIVDGDTVTYRWGSVNAQGVR